MNWFTKPLWLNTIEKLQTTPFFLVGEEGVAEAIQAACRDIC